MPEEKDGGNTVATALQLHIAAEIARPVNLPDPAVGEKLSAFFRRAIVTNSEVDGPAASCRSVGVDIQIPSAFCPASATEETLVAVHDGLAALRADPANRETATLFDTMWRLRPGGGLPLALRMALQPKINLGAPDAEASQSTYTPAMRRLDLARLAAKRRDTLIVQMCGRFRSGDIVAQAFAASGPHRAPIEMPKGWWDDAAVECSWRTDELRPRADAPAGTPHYRGIIIQAVGHAASPPADSTSKSRGTPVTAACSDSALDAFYRNRVAAWPANQPPPSEADDIEAARTHFGDLAPSRDRLREIRKRIAPTSWKAGPGRPKKSRR